MTDRTRHLIYWLGIGIAAVGGTMLMIQIDNLAWNRPIEVAAVVIGTALVAGGAFAFGWAK